MGKTDNYFELNGKLPDMDLVQFVHTVRKVQARSYVIPSKILVLVNLEQEAVSSAVAAGADALCLKDVPIQQLANSVRLTHTKGAYQDPVIAHFVPTAVL